MTENKNHRIQIFNEAIAAAVVKNNDIYMNYFNGSKTPLKPRIKTLIEVAL